MIGIKNSLWALSVVASAALGWQVHSWKVDSETLVAERSAASAMKIAAVWEFQSALKVETRLRELKANERVIHTVEQKIVDRPMYRTECIDDDGVQLIRGYATGGREWYEPGNPDGTLSD